MDIPAGVHSGQSLKVEGFGEAGIRGDRSGDLIVRVEVVEGERFQREGDDLYCMEDVTALEAMCGCTLDVEGVMADEHVSVSVPAGSQNAQHIEVEGYGMPRQGSHARGKLVVVLNVVVPTDLSAKQLEQIRDIAAERDERVGEKSEGGIEGLFGHKHGRAASARPKHGK